MDIQKEVADQYKGLFNLMCNNHDLILTINEMDEIIIEAQKVSNKLPSIDEIKKTLFNCAKVTIESDGVKMERLFEEEAKAMLSLFGGINENS